jgi:hypothetical protein
MLNPHPLRDGAQPQWLNTLVKSLGSLVRERRTLQRKGQQMAQRQHQLVKGLGRLLQGIGYQLTPISGGKVQSAQPNGAVKVGRRKHLNRSVTAVSRIPSHYLVT